VSTVPSPGSLPFRRHVLVLDHFVGRRTDWVLIVVDHVDVDKQQQHQQQRNDDQPAQQTIIVKHVQNKHHSRSVRDERSNLHVNCVVFDCDECNSFVRSPKRTKTWSRTIRTGKVAREKRSHKIRDTILNPTAVVISRRGWFIDNRFWFDRLCYLLCGFNRAINGRTRPNHIIPADLILR